MGAALGLTRTDHTSGELRALSSKCPDSAQVRRLLALALKFEELIRSGAVTNYTVLAQLGRVSRSRITQMTSLLNPAPDIQEEILFLRPEERSFESRSRRFGS